MLFFPNSDSVTSESLELCALHVLHSQPLTLQLYLDKPCFRSECQHHFLWEPHPDRLWDQVPFLCALVTLCTSCHRIYHNICRYSYLPWDYKLLKTVMVFLTQRWPRVQQSKPSNVCWMKKQTWEDNNLIHLSKKNGKSCLLSSQQTSIGITHQAYWNTGTFLWCSVSVSLRSFNFLP